MSQGSRHVLVTGASRGIGRGVAEAFAREGDAVTLLADDESVHSVAARIAQVFGTEVAARRCDITDAAALDRAFADIPPIDVLVSNAGVELPTPLDDGSAETHRRFTRIIDVNVTGTWQVMRAALRHLVDGGSVIVTASIWGRTAVPGFSAYVASKHALIGLTRTWARELAPRGIRVNAVCPGWVRTEASMASLDWMAEREGRAVDALLAEIEAGQSLPGLMEPDDIAGLYVYLASAAARGLTGQAIPVDRGEVMA
ncbi:SDR family NAD(P)-dependent oxidoreductase [Spiribacter onubensis]|uniref:SDR family oxidoreductase n=1 Tax=Spiribacter onubensis TaxID=3122420 RepID=A0ABV3S856_9GAMM